MEKLASKQALLIIDHGSKLEAANQMLEGVVELVRELRPSLIVEGCHMELADPSIEHGMAKCVEQGAQSLVAMPYMLSPGRHATSDIPNLVHQSAKAYPGLEVSVAKHLGVHKNIAELVLERASL